jgi:deoxyribodipyrimidine photo-lyase
VQPYNLTQISNYEEKRDFPAVDATSYLSPHLRFGTVSVRKMVNWAANTNAVFLSELIWREFLCKSCLTFPEVTNNFKPARWNSVE